jgi:hypothetical protein
VPIRIGWLASGPRRWATGWRAAGRLDTWLAYQVSRGLPAEELVDGYDSIVDPEASGRGSGFQPVPEPKVVKNRVHLDLTVSGGPRGSTRIPPAAGGR